MDGECGAVSPGDGHGADGATTVLDLVDAAALDHPSRVAVVGRDGQLSYRDLTTRAAGFAATLRSVGVRPGDRVVVVHSSTPTMIVAVLGVLAIGAAYVPVDPAQPVARVAAVVADSSAAALVTDRPEQFRLSGLRVIGTAAGTGTSPDADADAVRLGPVDPDAPAYLIYTSGSTGEPKGVVVGHRQLAFSTAARRQAYPGADPFLLVSPLAFDSSVAGLWGTLTAGGTLVLAGDAERRDPNALAALVVDFGVRASLMIPSLYRVLMGAAAESLTGLRLVVVAGEAMSDDLVRQHFATLPATELVNEYGPTEATVWATFRRYREVGPASIGTPVEGVQVQVLDAQGNPVAAGADGELYLGGSGVAEGYYGRPEATDLVFGPDPTGTDGGRWYRTGDLVRWAGGELQFLGRVDRQVKVRGRRVQLEAVEASLLRIPGVVQAAATVDDEHVTLVAHVRLDPDVQTAAVTAAVSGLPEELRPDRLHEHAQFPVNANGKVDLAALDRTAATPPAAQDTGAEDTVATQVTAAWREILHTGVIPADANFFDLGGNSLLVMRLQTALQQHTGRQVSLVGLFRHTTVAAQTALLSGPEQPVTGTDRPARRARTGVRRSRLDAGQS